MARLPCLATRAPAAAATSAAPQEMLNVCGPPPPVPTQSTSSSRSASVNGNGHGVPAHNVDKAGQLGSLLTARRENCHERSRFNIGHAAGEELLEHFGRLLTGERCAVFGQWLEQFFQLRHNFSMVKGQRRDVRSATPVGLAMFGLLGLRAPKILSTYKLKCALALHLKACALKPLNEFQPGGLNQRSKLRVSSKGNPGEVWRCRAQRRGSAPPLRRP